VLSLGQNGYLPLAAGSPPTSLAFTIPDAPAASLLARLRIDGIESPIIDLSQEPPVTPVFLNQRVVIS
jgi:hypothetical protein